MNDYALKARITATHCCICRKELTDAESVEHGIGPVCSRKYYDPDFLPNEKQVMNAIGLLQASGLPEHIIDEFLSCVDNLEGAEKNNARKACNLLIYWASCRYYDRDEVFRCSAIIRALGYDTLADKLEIDRTAARIEEKDGFLHVLVGKKYRFVRDLRRIPKIEETGEVSGDKTGWKVPLSEKDHFMAVLGLYYGNELACGGSRVWVIPHKRISDVLYFRTQHSVQPAPIPTPAPTPKVFIKVMPGYAKVFTPFNADYINALKQVVPFRHRRWTGECWEVTLVYLNAVKSLIHTHYGVALP